MKLSELRSIVQEHGGEVIDVGYNSFGSYTKAFVEVEFAGEVPTLSSVEQAEEVKSADTEWDPERNRAMYELVISERR